jgi:hypothetical protein
MAGPIGFTTFEGFAIDRRAMATGLLTAAAALALPLPAMAAQAVGAVDAAKGSTTGLLEGRIRELSTGAEVYLQEIVQTGSGARLSIVLGPETKLKLGERTRIRIDKNIVAEGSELTLDSGAVLFDRPDSAPQAEIVMKTPFAVIAARGTGFWAGPSNGVTGIFASHGVITVSNNAGEVTLTAGLGTDLTDPNVAPTPPKKWGEARVQAALSTIN